MDLVVDANILVSGLLKNGITRELMLNNELDLYTSEFIFTEFFKHLKDLAKKACMDINEFKDLAEILIVESKLKVITKDEIKSHIDKADKISLDIDDAFSYAKPLAQQYVQQTYGKTMIPQIYDTYTGKWEF